MIDLVVIGAGPAGLFAAIWAKSKHPESNVCVLEGTNKALSKLRRSGGGRCNLTNALADNRLLIDYYPRGHQELMSPFSRFSFQDTIDWFQSKGVSLQIEDGGRVFPKSSDSEEIAQCLLDQLNLQHVKIHYEQKIQKIQKRDSFFRITTTENDPIDCKKLLIATGSNIEGYEWAKSLGHSIRKPVPSLFGLQVPDFPLKQLSGIAIDPVEVSIGSIPKEPGKSVFGLGQSPYNRRSQVGSYCINTDQLGLSPAVVDFRELSRQPKSRFSRFFGYKQIGSLLITHFGFSGPAILKLSSFHARELYEMQYCASLKIDWLPQLSMSEASAALMMIKEQFPSFLVSSKNPFSWPRAFWDVFLEPNTQLLSNEILTKNFANDFFMSKRWCDVSKKQIEFLIQRLKKDSYQIDGKSQHKEEFVTCGGIERTEVNFKTMESKICPNLFFAGEILDIDGITGGFNLQNAWTTGYLAGVSPLTSVKYF